jgi:hypothetical protein
MQVDKSRRIGVWFHEEAYGKERDAGERDAFWEWAGHAVA